MVSISSLLAPVFSSHNIRTFSSYSLFSTLKMEVEYSFETTELIYNKNGVGSQKTAFFIVIITSNVTFIYGLFNAAVSRLGYSVK
jgi:hypothetical protein